MLGYTYPMAGEHVAGTLPQENIVAAIRQVDIAQQVKGQAAPFPYPVAGTAPDTNAIGIITGDGMTAAVDTSIARFDFPLCGDDNG